MREYIDEEANIVKVSDGISGGKFWMTCRVKPSGALQRVKSKFLPIRNKREEAQADLDVYAEERGWTLIVGDLLCRDALGVFGIELQSQKEVVL